MALACVFLNLNPESSGCILPDTALSTICLSIAERTNSSAQARKETPGPYCLLQSRHAQLTPQQSSQLAANKAAETTGHYRALVTYHQQLLPPPESRDSRRMGHKLTTAASTTAGTLCAHATTCSIHTAAGGSPANPAA